MLSRQLTTILLAMTLVEAIDTRRIHCIAGLRGERAAFVTTRSCRTPSDDLGGGADQLGLRADAG
jgi:hypothetical protein